MEGLQFLAYWKDTSGSCLQWKDFIISYKVAEMEGLQFLAYWKYTSGSCLQTKHFLQVNSARVG